MGKKKQEKTDCIIKYCPFCHCRKEPEFKDDEFSEDGGKIYIPGLIVRELGLTRHTRYAVKCLACGAQGPDADSEAKAITLWDNRGVGGRV